MTSNDNPRFEKELQTRVNEVLHYIWDPIDVRGEPYARDEYDSYVPHVCALLQGGAAADEIAFHLDKIATENMGLNSNLSHVRVAAENLLDWREKLLQDRPEILG